MDFYIYRIYVNVRDSQGRRCRKPHIIPVQACQCDSRNYCTSGATRIIIIGGRGGGSGSGGSAGGGATGNEGGTGGGGTGGGGIGGGGIEGGQQGGVDTEPGGGGEYRPAEDTTEGQGYTDGYSEGGEGYTAATDYGYGDGNYGRDLESATTLSGSAIGLMFLGGLIFVCKYKVRKTTSFPFIGGGFQKSF